jgi:hypothetical protein
VTALLPVAQGVGLYAALKRAADSTFDDRSRGQERPNTVASRSAGLPTAAVAEAGDAADEDLLGPRGCPNVIKP